MTNFYFTHDVSDYDHIEEDAVIEAATSKEDMIAALLPTYDLEEGEKVYLIKLRTSDCWIKTNDEPTPEMILPFNMDQVYVAHTHPGVETYWVSPTEVVYGIFVGDVEDLYYPEQAEEISI